MSIALLAVLAFIVPAATHGAAPGAEAAEPAHGEARLSSFAIEEARDKLLQRPDLPKWSTNSKKRPTEADLLTRKSTCYEEVHSDTPDGTRIDVTDYGMFYECTSAEEWAFVILTADDWLDHELDYVDLYMDVDGTPTTGCGGFELAIFGFYSTTYSQLVAGMYSIPTCETASLLGPTDLYRSSAGTLALYFDNRSLGSPSQVIWTASVAAMVDTTADDLPDSGYHVTSDFYAPDACSTAEYDGYVVDAQDKGVEAALKSSGATEIRRTGEAVAFRGSGASALRFLRRAGIGGRVELNPLMIRYQAPSDPMHASQWALSAVNASDAWDVTLGSAAISVAVIDSGVDGEHPELAGQLVAGYDAYTSQPLPTGNTDVMGHGTAVSGVIAAVTDNAAGIASLGWSTTVMPVRVDDDLGQISMADVASGVRWATDQGARIINLSLGTCVYSQVLADAIDYALAQDVLVVAATGNEATEGNFVNYPAGIPGVLAVGATGFDGARASYSNTGSHVDIVAPGGSGDQDAGHSILTLQAGGGTGASDGTSFSAPLTAAAAALLLAVKPDLSAQELTQALTTSATDLGLPGRDDEHGFGLLNVPAALRSVSTTTPSPTPTASASASPSPSPTPTTPAATLDRLWGTDRLGTAIAISQDNWTSQEAQSVTLARWDTFPDALAGTPLAVAKGGPLLLTPPGSLSTNIGNEIKRVLPSGSTVYLLGGTTALSPVVAEAVTNLGYRVVRLGGADRYSTAVLINRQLGSPSNIFIATGLNFPYALISGAVAASTNGVVVLTADRQMPTPTRNYLDAHSGAQRVAVGPEASAADPSAMAITSPNIYETSRLLATTFLPTSANVAVASGTVFADALSGGAHIGRLGGPLLLSDPQNLPVATARYFDESADVIRSATLYGGTAALSTAVEDAIRSKLR